MTELSLNSTFLMDFVADVEPAQNVGATPHGIRQIFIVKGGWFEGPRLKGKILAGGGDWLVLRSDGVGEIDVRATIETDDGALIYVTYQGVLNAPIETLLRFGSDNPPRAEEFYFRTAPRFETGDARYQWLNAAVFVGIGNPGHLKIVKNQVAYRIFQVL